MTTELKVLGWAISLGILQLLMAAHLATRQRGMKWNLSPRDERSAELTGVAGRTDRAFKNFMETFPFFAAAILAAQASNRLTSFTALGAQLYILARVIYIPVYAAGIPVLRTGIWLASLIGILLVLWPLLFA